MQTIEYLEIKQQNTEYVQRQILRIIKEQERSEAGRDTFGTTVAKEGWITDDAICVMMNKPPSFERAVRLAIRDLRLAGQPIVSESGRGYRWPRSRAEVDVTISELRSRIAELNHVCGALERGRDALFGGQEALW